MKLPAAERRRPTVWDGVLAALVVVAAVLLLLWLRPADTAVLSAVISVDSVPVAEYQLDTVSQPVRLSLSDLPYPMTLEITADGAHIVESSCPGQDCVHTGWADRAGDQIICLPNRLILSLSGAEELPFDAVTG